MGAVAMSRDDEAIAGRSTRTSANVALVERAQAGDRRAFAALYRAHGRMVHGLLLTRLPRAELRDAMQDVFLAALAKLDSLRDPARFGAWLAAIARNRARDWSKRHGRTREHSWEPQAVDEHEPARVTGPGMVESLALLAQLRGLPEAQRELLILRFVEGLSGPEIAEVLGMTPGSVRVKLHRSLELLRRQSGGERR